MYQQYKALADATSGVYFVGRLATYKYYNMDQVVAQALAVYRKAIGTRTVELPVRELPVRETAVRESPAREPAVKQVPAGVSSITLPKGKGSGNGSNH